MAGMTVANGLLLLQFATHNGEYDCCQHMAITATICYDDQCYRCRLRLIILMFSFAIVCVHGSQLSFSTLHVHIVNMAGFSCS